MDDARALAGRLAEWIVDYALMGATLGDPLAEVERWLRHDFPELDRLSAPEGVGLKRYRVTDRTYPAVGKVICADIDPDGEWVRHEDAAAALATLKERINNLSFHHDQQTERAEVAEAERDALKAAMPWPAGPFAFGDRVEKTKGSSWHGTVCGWYSTSLTPLGYNVESEREPGSVQLYPAVAISKTQGGG